MRPLLELASDGQTHSLRDARTKLAERFRLTDEEKNQLLPSGRQPLFGNRVARAKSYLQAAGLLESPQRGHFKISDRGHRELQETPERITVRDLEKFPEFVEFRATPKKQRIVSPEVTLDDAGHPPEEMLEGAYARLRPDLASELLRHVKKCSPQFFEELVVEVLRKRGYGGSREEADEAVGTAGDEGIDGVINEDRLGLDTIYLQAKRRL
jgi:restriction system protein